MAVYTHLTDDEIRRFLDQYNLGDLVSATGIPQGIDNTNYKIVTTSGNYILTVFENRIDPQDLPFFMEYMAHLSSCGIVCPAPVPSIAGDVIGALKSRPAIIVTFLNGDGVVSSAITPSLCFELGVLLGHIHVAGIQFKKFRTNSMGVSAWKDRVRRIVEEGHGKGAEFLPAIQNELEFLDKNWPMHLPRGAVHADLFPDNVFVVNGHVHGVIDFYFSATDFLAYDLAITLNAWCFDSSSAIVPERVDALMRGYTSIYKMSDEERQAFPILARGAALRFLVTRLHDLVFHDSAALVTPKDPSEYLTKLEFHQHEHIFFRR